MLQTGTLIHLYKAQRNPDSTSDSNPYNIYTHTATIPISSRADTKTAQITIKSTPSIQPGTDNGGHHPRSGGQLSADVPPF